ncbi:MAG TPA: SpoIIE family protein phosphatase [Gemmatimonadales bacterium]|nr:SpoIIE family protein phosphatase [Gemmatimonadales bacterium]
MFQPFAGDDVSGCSPATNRSISCRLTDSSTIGQARRTAAALGSQAGLDGTALGNLSLVVSELAGNAVQHAGGGELLLRITADSPRAGVEVLCLDRGPGIRDITESLRDGYSTGGTMGTGLGAVRRLASDFDLYSVPGQGSAALARVHATGPSGAAHGARIAGLALPIRGETVSGDAWATLSVGGRTLVLVVDGLGHGRSAADAANAATLLFCEHGQKDLAELMTVLHQGLRATRGAAAAIAEIDPATRELRYTGIGNISGYLLTGSHSRSLVSHNGIVGHQARPVRVLTYPWQQGTMLILHSDGVSSRWKAEAYPGLLRRDPAIVAGILYRDHARDLDDHSVVACRLGTQEPLP